MRLQAKMQFARKNGVYCNLFIVHDSLFASNDAHCGSVVAERLRAPNSNFGVSDQQSVG